MRLNKDKKEIEIKSPTEEFNKLEIGKAFVEGFEEGIKEGAAELAEAPIFEPKTGIVTGCNSLYVRSAPHSNASPVDVINGGTTVKIIGEEGDFWQLEKPEGFSMKKFIKVV